MKHRRAQQIARWHRSPRGVIAAVAALSLLVVGIVITGPGGRSGQSLLTEIGPWTSGGMVIVLPGRIIQTGSSWSSLGILARVAMVSLKVLTRVLLLPLGAGSSILLGIVAVFVLHVASGFWTHRSAPAPLCPERR